MKKTVLVLALFFIVSFAFSRDFIYELEKSIARAQAGSNVEYVLHFGNDKQQVFTGSDFTSGKLMRNGANPLYFELFKGKGEKKHNIMINLRNPVYYKLDIEKIDGVWSYSFHFYY